MTIQEIQQIKEVYDVSKNIKLAARKLRMSEFKLRMLRNSLGWPKKKTAYDRSKYPVQMSIYEAVETSWK